MSTVRIAGSEDARLIGALLHAFAEEFGDPTPGPTALAQRAAALAGSDDEVFLLAGRPVAGVAHARFRISIWSAKPYCYLESLYVKPDRRREGLGRALLVRVVEITRQRGGKQIGLATQEHDTAARALYESEQFTEKDGGGRMLYYERKL